MGTASNATSLDDQEEKVMCSEVFQTKEGVTSMQDFPCKNCQKRHTGCHGTCSEYLLAQTENARKMAYANAQKRISRDEAAVTVEHIRKLREGRYPRKVFRSAKK